MKAFDFLNGLINPPLEKETELGQGQESSNDEYNDIDLVENGSIRLRFKHKECYDDLGLNICRINL